MGGDIGGIVNLHVFCKRIIFNQADARYGEEQFAIIGFDILRLRDGVVFLGVCIDSLHEGVVWQDDAFGKVITVNALRRNDIKNVAVALDRIHITSV